MKTRRRGGANENLSNAEATKKQKRMLKRKNNRNKMLNQSNLSKENVENLRTLNLSNESWHISPGNSYEPVPANLQPEENTLFDNNELNEPEDSPEGPIVPYPYFPLNIPACQTDPFKVASLPNETFEENYERVLVFYKAIRDKVPVDFTKKALSRSEKSTFLDIWRQHLPAGANMDSWITSTLQNVFRTTTDETEIDQQILKFIGEGKPILAHNCLKHGSSFQGPLRRFLTVVSDSQQNIRNVSDYSSIVCAAPTDIGSDVSYNLEDLCVSVVSRKIMEPYPFGLDVMRSSDQILTIQIQPTGRQKIENQIQNPKGILVKGSAFKNTTFLQRYFRPGQILDISPQLAFLFYRDHQECSITERTCRDLLGTGFSYNYFPSGIFETHTRLRGKDRRIKDQYEMAYYLICHTIAGETNSSVDFYTSSNNVKHYQIVEFLQRNPDFFDRPLIREQLEWSRLRPAVHNVFGIRTKMREVLRAGSVSALDLNNFFINAAALQGGRSLQRRKTKKYRRGQKRTIRRR